MGEVKTTVNLLARLVRRSTLLTCSYYILDDWRTGRRLRKGYIETRSGARHASLDTAASVSYIERVWGDYLSYAGRSSLGPVVAEIGPGDNLGVALLALRSGAREVHCIDRYHSKRDAAQQARIYQALSARHDLTPWFDGQPSEATLRGISYHAGMPAETFFRNSSRLYDAIISRAVLEHLTDPIAALDDMAKVIAPGGVLVHRVDFRDHGMFAGRHPLNFLTIPQPIYTRMTRRSGRPNRVLAPLYRAWLGQSGLVGSIRIVRLVGVSEEFPPMLWSEIPVSHRQRALQEVARIRRRLVEPFDEFDEEDLAASAIVLCAERR